MTRKRIIVTLVAVGAVYAAASYFLIAPSTQLNIVRLAVASVQKGDVNGSEYLKRAEQSVAGLEAYLKSRKSEQFAARVADLVKRQNAALAGIATLEGQMATPLQNIASLNGKVAALERTISSAEKNDKGTVANQVGEMMKHIESFKTRIETLKVHGTTMARLKEEISLIEEQLPALKHPQHGPVVIIRDLRAHFERSKTELTNLERGDTNQSGTLTSQVEGLESEVAALKRRATTLQRQQLRVDDISVQVGLTPAPRRATARSP